MLLACGKENKVNPIIAASTATLLLIFISSYAVSSHPAAALTTDRAPVVRTTTVSVYNDGTAEVNQTIVPGNATLVTLPMFSSQVGNIIAIDASKSPVSYEINNGNITLYNLGAKEVNLAYDTSALTTKQGAVWTVKFFTPFNVTLALPSESTILSFSSPPLSASSAGNIPKLELAPGSWEVSYGLPLRVSVSSNSNSVVLGANGVAVPESSSQTTNSGVAGLLPQLSGSSIYLAAAFAVAVAIGLFGTFLARQRVGAAADTKLRYDDEQVLQFIKEKGGRVIESEIREHFSLPRTSAWRQAKRLEKHGFLRITKIGSQNQIELVRTDFTSSLAE